MYLEDVFSCINSSYQPLGMSACKFLRGKKFLNHQLRIFIFELSVSLRSYQFSSGYPAE